MTVEPYLFIKENKMTREEARKIAESKAVSPNVVKNDKEMKEIVKGGKMSEWQPIKSAPQDGTHILVYRPGKHRYPKVGVDFWQINRAPINLCG